MCSIASESASPVFTNPGFCNICMKETTFVAHQAWLRDFYLCETCGTSPRQRAMVEVLSWVRPNWRDLRTHESSPCVWFYRDQCKQYSFSYLFDGVPLGTYKDGARCEDLERLSFDDETFDIFLTQDVLEHVFDPRSACREIMRVLVPGGLHLFTAPKHKHILKSYPRAKIENGECKYLRPPVYHGNPIGDGKSLVTWDYGADFDDLLKEWCGYNVSNIVLRDRNRGIDGEYLDVFVAVKDTQNKLG